jgi:DNA-binding PadR family transcriptional regulator
MTKGQIRAELGPVSDGTLKSSLHRLMERGAIRADRTEDGGYSYTRHAEGRRRARRLGPVDGPRTLRIVVSGN